MQKEKEYFDFFYGRVETGCRCDYNCKLKVTWMDTYSFVAANSVKGWFTGAVRNQNAFYDAAYFLQSQGPAKKFSHTLSYEEVYGWSTYE